MRYNEAMRHVPRSFVLALAGGAGAACVLAFARAATRRDPRDLDSAAAVVVDAASHALEIAVAALLLAGGVALWRRDARRLRMLVAGASVLLAVAIARPVCEWMVLDRLSSYQAVLEWRRWLAAVGATGGFAFALGVVSLGEHDGRVRNLAVPLLVLAVLARPPVEISDAIARWLDDVPGTSSVWKAAIGLGAIQVAHAATALAALAAAVPARR